MSTSVSLISQPVNEKMSIFGANPVKPDDFHKFGSNPVKPDDFHKFGTNPIKPDDFYHFGAASLSPFPQVNQQASHRYQSP